MVNNPCDYLQDYDQINELIVGFSGGLDSTVLLHMLSTDQQTQQRYTLKALHVDHQLQTNSGQWAAHCEAFCHKHNIAYETLSVKVEKQPGKSLEAQARGSRYDALSQYIDEHSCLLTAHHQDDQAETLLLQLMRGAGPTGLASMPVMQPFADGYHYRPLLTMNREQLQAYAQSHQLKWIDDQSNFDTCFDRNYLRHEIMPRLTKRWPACAKTMSRSAQLCAEADTLLNQYTDEQLQQLINDHENILSIDSLKILSLPRLQQLLRHWLIQCDLTRPSYKKLQHIIHDVVFSRADSVAHVHWQGGEVRRYGTNIYAMKPLEDFNTRQIIAWDLQQDLHLPANIGTLRISRVNKQGLIIPAGAKVDIRFRQGGEVIQLVGRDGHHKLKKLMQQWHIPPWQRERIPLIYINDHLAQVVGLAIDQQYISNNHQAAYNIQLIL